MKIRPIPLCFHLIPLHAAETTEQFCIYDRHPPATALEPMSGVMYFVRITEGLQDKAISLKSVATGPSNFVWKMAWGRKTHLKSSGVLYKSYRCRYLYRPKNSPPPFRMQIYTLEEHDVETAKGDVPLNGLALIHILSVQDAPPRHWCVFILINTFSASPLHQPRSTNPSSEPNHAPTFLPLRALSSQQRAVVFFILFLASSLTGVACTRPVTGRASGGPRGVRHLKTGKRRKSALPRRQLPAAEAARWWCLPPLCMCTARERRPGVRMQLLRLSRRARSPPSWKASTRLQGVAAFLGRPAPGRGRAASNIAGYTAGRIERRQRAPLYQQTLNPGRGKAGEAWVSRVVPGLRSCHRTGWWRHCCPPLPPPRRRVQRLTG